MQIQNITPYSYYSKRLNNHKKENETTNISFNGKEKPASQKNKPSDIISKIKKYFLEAPNFYDACSHFTVYKSKKIGDEKFDIEIKDNLDYRMYDKSGEEVASMHLCHPILKEFHYEDEFYEKTKNGPLIIRSLKTKNKKCKNYLIKEAIKTSKRLGYKGCIIIYASNSQQEYNKCQGMDYENAYNLNIIAYQDKGFKAISKKTQKEIESGIKTLNCFGVYTGPIQAYMYLPKEKMDLYLKSNDY